MQLKSNSYVCFVRMQGLPGDFSEWAILTWVSSKLYQPWGVGWGICLIASFYSYNFDAYNSVSGVSSSERQSMPLRLTSNSGCGECFKNRQAHGHWRKFGGVLYQGPCQSL